MRVRKVRRGRELLTLPEGGDAVACPHCGVRWLTRLEGSADQATCTHLRFTWYAGVFGGSPEFAGAWDPGEFERRFAARYARLTRTVHVPGAPLPVLYDPEILRAVLRGVAEPEIDVVLHLPFFERHDELCAEAAIFWGVHRGLERVPVP